jgi:hypothetical protein
MCTTEVPSWGSEERWHLLLGPGSGYRWKGMVWGLVAQG